MYSTFHAYMCRAFSIVLLLFYGISASAQSGWFDVTAYGASTASSDNHPYFDAAWAALLANGGGTLFIPCGIFKIYTPDGSNAAVQWYTASLYTPIRVHGQAAGCSVVQYTGSTTTGAVAQLAKQAPPCWHCDPGYGNYALNATIENVAFIGNENVSDGLSLIRVGSSAFRDVYAWGVTVNGIYVQAGVANKFDRASVNNQTAAYAGWVNLSPAYPGAPIIAPQNGLVFDGFSPFDQSTTSDVDYPVLQGVAGNCGLPSTACGSTPVQTGAALSLMDAGGLTITSAQISDNVNSLYVDPWSYANTFISNLFEQTGKPISQGTVAYVTVTAGGSGYTTPPAVSFTGGSGTGATASAIIASGAVVKVKIANSGSGYLTTPSVSFTGGSGSGAAATAEVSTPTVANGGGGYYVGDTFNIVELLMERSQERPA